jgi:hypothetical protein
MRKKAEIEGWAIYCPVKMDERKSFIDSQIRNVAFFVGAGPCRPGNAGATRPGSDLFYDMLFLRFNSREPQASAKKDEG